MMRIFGLLCWWQERPDWLERCILSLGKVPIDHLVAVDGAYRLMPGCTPRSDPAQAEAIERACDQLGIDCTIHVPDGVWEGGEVEKRTFMFDLAFEHAEPPRDWYMVMDADQVVGRCNDVKARLEATDLDCADTLFVERPNPDLPPDRQVASRFVIRNFFRAIPGLRVEGAHYIYRDPAGRYLWGNATSHKIEPGLDLRDVQIAHKTYQRDAARRAQSVEYYQQRDALAVEMAECDDCGTGNAKYSVHVNWERHPNGKQLMAGTVTVCEACVPKRNKQAERELRALGVSDPQQIRWQGYAHVPS